MADGNARRHRFGAVVLGLVVLAAVLAVFPATAPFGMLLCFLLLIPAIVAVWRARRAPVGARRRAVAALVVAPVFFVVGAGVMAAGLPSRPPVAAVAEIAPAAVPAVSTSEPATAPLAAAPTTETAALQAPAVVAAAAAPAAAPGAVAPQVVTAPRPVMAPKAAAPKAAAPKAATPQAVVAKPAPKPAAAPQPVAAKPAAPKPAAGSSCGTDSYINSAGNCVPRPVAAPSAPAGATAQCKDGTYSFSQTHSGTCSRHGGVSRWL